MGEAVCGQVVAGGSWVKAGIYSQHCIVKDLENKEGRCYFVYLFIFYFVPPKIFEMSFKNIIITTGQNVRHKIRTERKICIRKR